MDARTKTRLLVEKVEKRNALLTSLFPEQQAAIFDESHKKIIWTTRRAGKTFSVLIDFVDDAQRKPLRLYAYIGLTRPSAEDIAWNLLKKIDRQHKLGCIFHESKLRCTLPNGSIIKLYGADKKGWASRLYGSAYRKIAIDEAAFYSISLYDLVEDYLEPATIDQNGQIYLMSIPGHLPRGLFFDATKEFSYKEKLSGVRSKKCPDWSIHRWTTLDNPHMRTKFAQKIAEKKKDNPKIEEDPKFIRNYLGAWVVETGEQVYRFSEERNGIDSYARRPGDRYILGIDFGWDDFQAFSLCVWNEDNPNFIEIESRRYSQILLDKIASYVRMYRDFCGGEMLIIGDPAHKQLFEEFRRRFDFPVIPSEKSNKFDWIEIINTDLVSGKIKIVSPGNSIHVEEMQDLTWFEKTGGWRVEQPGMKNDCSDAFLLAYRYAYHYRYEEKPAAPIVDSPEYYQQQEDEYLRVAEQLFEEANGKGGWNDLS